MATYTALQLRGAGTHNEVLSGEKTFTFTNPSSSAYFTLETNRTSSGYYDSNSPTNAVGVYSTSASMGLVTSSYIASIVVQPGVSTFTYNSTVDVAVSSSKFRGTGEYSLTIT